MGMTTFGEIIWPEGQVEKVKITTFEELLVIQGFLPTSVTVS